MKAFLLLLYTVCFCLFATISYSQNSEIESIKESIKKARNEAYTNPVIAAENAKKTYERALFQKHTTLAVEALTVYGWSTMLSGDYGTSINAFYDALDICPADSVYRLGAIENVMSYVYRSLGDYDKALEFVKKGKKHFQQINDSVGLANNYNYHGLIMYSLKQPQKAEELFYKALNINRILNDKKSIAANINNLCLLTGKSEEKIKLLQEAIEINKQLNATWSLAENYNNLGCHYYYLTRYNEALTALDIAYEYAQKIKAKELLCENLKYHSLIYAAQKDYAMAYNSSRLENKLRHELQIERQSISTHRINETQLDRLKKSRELLQKEYELSMLRKNAVISVVFICLSIILLFVWIKWRSKKKKIVYLSIKYKLEQAQREVMELQVKKQEETIKNVDDELRTAKGQLGYFVFFMQSRDELLRQIKDMIKSGYKMKGEELQTHLKKINVFISQYQITDKNCLNLSNQANMQNKDFLQRLLLRFPELTDGEKKLAVLLRMGLSIQEISLLTGTQPKTVGMGRYRLRKQLSLKQEENLVVFLCSI